jgi:preprotein translocase subunit YajC
MQGNGSADANGGLVGIVVPVDAANDDIEIKISIGLDDTQGTFEKRRGYILSNYFNKKNKSF